MGCIFAVRNIFFGGGVLIIFYSYTAHLILGTSTTALLDRRKIYLITQKDVHAAFRFSSMFIVIVDCCILTGYSLSTKQRLTWPYSKVK